MKVKTAELKNHLCKYLRRVREKGETIIVYDRDEAVATLAPIHRDQNTEWERCRAEALARAAEIGLKIEIPAAPMVRAMPVVKPRTAPDRRTDIRTVERMRKERQY